MNKHVVILRQKRVHPVLLNVEINGYVVVPDVGAKMITCNKPIQIYPLIGNLD